MSGQTIPVKILKVYTADLAHYGTVHAVRIGSANALVFKTDGSRSLFIYQAENDVNDSDYIQIRTYDGEFLSLLMKGTNLVGFSNMTTGNGKGVFAFTGAGMGLFSVDIPANLRLSGNGSAVGIIADDDVNKGVIMKYLSATKKLTFVNELGEKNELVLS